MTIEWHSAENSAGDEAQGAFASDRESKRNVEWMLIVKEGIEGVAHRVFDGKQPVDYGLRLWIRAHSVTQGGQALS